jgi:Na+/proline symporter
MFILNPFFSPVELHEFSVADYVVFILTIVVSLGIGIYYALSGGRQRTTSEYLVGNRKMAVLPVAISLMVSFESSIMMLGTPAEIYRYGIQWIWANLGFFCANLLAIKIMVPLIHPLKITSANEVICFSLHQSLISSFSKK